ncbi:MAG: NAD-dependent epimerase/dehydratase family protein [Thermoleophilia bacterium]
MKVFVAGATGAIGTRLVPRLLGEGHHVVATSRSIHKIQQLRALGARCVAVDALDESATMRAVLSARPDVIVHELTALTGAGNMKRFDDEYEQTNRLRTQGLDYLLRAARAAGTRRVVAQSYAGWPNIRRGGPVKTEADPLDPDPPPRMRKTLEAIRYLEDTLTGASDLEGLALRYGSLYGPGTSFSEDGRYVTLLERRRLPIIGDGAGVWSFVHVDDAIGATIAALERGRPGCYNIVDDEPAPVSVWLPDLARVLRAKPPRHLPTWVGRLATGDAGVSMMTQIRGSSNAKAKRELGWEPRYKSWRQGFRWGLSDEEIEEDTRRRIAS